MQEVIWSTLRVILACHPEVMVDSSLDKIVMCCIYSVCKISKLPEVLFNEIISEYGAIQTASNQELSVFRECLIDSETGEQGDIITFYNRVFLSITKATIDSISIHIGHIVEIINTLQTLRRQPDSSPLVHEQLLSC
jgi:hypothetical protein